jgi:hypothetical protein
MKSRFAVANRRGALMDRFGIEYGTGGLFWLALQVGFFGAIVYLLLFYRILRRAVYYFAVEVDPYWRSFGLGMVVFSFTMLFMSSWYSPYFKSDSIASFFFCLAGFIIRRTEVIGTAHVS